MQAHLYIHIPFCKKACHYCSFYFSTSTAILDKWYSALLKEIELKSAEWENHRFISIYFGGGTPSVLSPEKIEILITKIHKYYTIDNDCEVCMESNPENLTREYIENVKKTGVNRLSIGIQSFDDRDLKIMNRNHNASQSISAIENAVSTFDNVSIDLMFGLPFNDLKSWEKNLDIALQYDLKHVSTYNLTIEEKTALKRKIERKEIAVKEDNLLNNMYLLALEKLRNVGFENYEISNFAKIGYESTHNKGYWFQNDYLGLGPSAHSLKENLRIKNVSNNMKYIDGIKNNTTFYDTELLNEIDKYNEYILTRLRTKEGIKFSHFKTLFDNKYIENFEKNIFEYIDKNKITYKEEKYTLSDTGKLIADAISSDLMWVE